MSALAVALQAYNNLHYNADGPSSSSRPSSPLSLPSLTHSGVSSSSSSLIDVPTQLSPLTPVSCRPNEHLAVFLPKQLWKPDNLSTVCDNFYCRVAFGLFERRHHCRKCGGVFCGACSSRTTRLLDTSKLDFVHPPRNVPISDFESPDSPIFDARVCDDCWDQIHGLRSQPHTPTRPTMKRALSHPMSMLRIPTTTDRSGSDSSLSSRASTSVSPVRHVPSSPSRAHRTRSLRPSPSNSSLSTTSSSTSSPSVQHRSGVLRTAHLPLPLELERSYGELDAYPLKRSSVLCKATGGGRWEPKQSPVLDGYRPPIPGGKAPFEIEMEREEREERARRENTLVTDGEIRYRLMPRAGETSPTCIARSPFALSTF